MANDLNSDGSEKDQLFDVYERQTVGCQTFQIFTWCGDTSRSSLMADCNGNIISYKSFAFIKSLTSI
jgi:hypothetical protein